MNYASIYNSKLGEMLIILNSNKELVSLSFRDSKCFFKENYEMSSDFDEMKNIKDYLDLYFEGKIQEFNRIKMNLCVSDFQRKVLDIVKQIEYGKVMTYGDIANILAKDNINNKMSAQAVGSAIGKNPINIIIPCHRVVNKNKVGNYVGGVERKINLLKLEGVNLEF